MEEGIVRPATHKGGNKGRVIRRCVSVLVKSVLKKPGETHWAMALVYGLIVTQHPRRRISFVAYTVLEDR